MRRPGLALLAALWLVLAAPPAGAATDPGQELQWGLRIVGAPVAWARATGRGVVIAVVDSGVDASHEDLAGKIVAGYDFVEDDTSPQDEEGHGTHVAGIAAAATGNGRGIAGVAPDAKIMPVRVLDGNGEGFEEDVTAAIRWAVDQGADVVNLSLEQAGIQLLGDGSSFEDAVDYAWSKGVVCVVAAGNTSLFTTGPGDLRGIVVSATDRDDRRPGYSRGVGDARWGLAAPGGTGAVSASEDDILSTDWSPEKRNQYAYRAGTSQAAPHVSGAVALLRSRGLSASQAVSRLLSTAKDLGAAGTDSTFGAGRLDVAKAVGTSASSPSPSPKPKATASPAKASPSSRPSSAPAAASASPSPRPDASPKPFPLPSPATLPTAQPVPTRTGSPLASSPDGDGPSTARLAAAWAIGAALVAALALRALIGRWR